ncbi:MAG: DUF4186 family protein [Spirochaetaceae bacterium]|nr:DUF4186 family protein [Spirochaetaceae bacterium]
MPEFQKPPPLNIKCTSADCENELHCFKQLKKMTEEQRGKCRYCGADLVDWDRLHMRDFGDVAYTFAALKNEMIRHFFFHREIDERAVRHGQRKGRIQLKEAARHRLSKYLAPATPARDGRQTPFEGNAIYYAQHATATCCRTCLEYWHDIPKGRELTAEEQAYCAALVDLYLDERLPELADTPIRVPNLRRHAASSAPSEKA